MKLTEAFKVTSVLGAAIALAGCTFNPMGIAWMVRGDETYVVSTPQGDSTVTCEWMTGDSAPYFESTTGDTGFEWVCDAIPVYWGQGAPPQTIVDKGRPNEVAHRR